MENLIMVSPTHVPFERTAQDKKTMTGRSVATFKNEDIPFVSADFRKINATKYYKHPGAEYKVMGMWIAYHDAYFKKHIFRNNAFLEVNGLYEYRYFRL